MLAYSALLDYGLTRHPPSVCPKGSPPEKSKTEWISEKANLGNQAQGQDQQGKVQNTTKANAAIGVWALDGAMKLSAKWRNEVWALDCVMKLSARWRNEVWVLDSAMKLSAQWHNEVWALDGAMKLSARWHGEVWALDNTMKCSA